MDDALAVVDPYALLDRSVVRLTPPIELQGQKYQELRLREPTCGEVLLGDMQVERGVTVASTRNRQISILSAVSATPVPVWQRVPISQFNHAWGYVQDFLNDGLGIGGS